MDEIAATSSRRTITIAVTPKEPSRGSRITSRRRAESPPPSRPSAQSASPSRWMAPVRMEWTAIAQAAASSGAVSELSSAKVPPATRPIRAPIAGKYARPRRSPGPPSTFATGSTVRNDTAARSERIVTWTALSCRGG